MVSAESLKPGGEKDISRRTIWWVLRTLELRSVTIALAALAPVLGLATFMVLSGGRAFAHHPTLQTVVFLLTALALGLLAIVAGRRLLRLLIERRRSGAGARLHVRLVVLFSLVAAAPTILVGVFATLFFDYGIQIWFSDRVNTALTEALQASHGYLSEHNDNIRTEALSLANYLASAESELSASGADLMQEPQALGQILDSQATIRGLAEAVVYDPITKRVIASGGLMTRAGYLQALPPPAATMMARSNDVAIFDSPDEKTVRAVVALGETPERMLVITRSVDPEILGHMRKTEQVVADYKRLNHNREKIQVTFVMIFALVALLVLAAAALMGVGLANQIASPLGQLMLAARRVSEGDLSVRVPEGMRDDEVSDLSRAFNRMTDELASQRSELMAAYAQIDDRRRFTEAVLSGVSAGVIGLDGRQRIELPNRAASFLLDTDLMQLIGRPLAEAVPEFSPMLEGISQSADKVRTMEIQAGPTGRRRVLLARVSAELRGAETEGYVVTFDDITALQQAQRKAAWADVARRIAHEIKNPLTPIQLAAERLKRRFLKEISSDPETFRQCADTIVRQVGDIGRMVDEFSAFARMPQPVIQREELGRLVRESVVLQRDAHPDILYTIEAPEHETYVACDRRQIGQALTNLLQNAADAIAMTGRKSEDGNCRIGSISLGIQIRDGMAVVAVADDGVGLPQMDRDRLTEPYVTYKPRGTGLGLAIVKKIMEDHEGDFRIHERQGGAGTEAILILPLKEANGV